MSVVFECPGCSKRLKSSPETAGRRVKCPGCGAGMLVPGEEADFEVLPEDDFEVIEEPPAKPVKPVNRRRQVDNDDDEYKTEMVRCPECGEDNYADARRCADCKARLTDDDPPPMRKKKRKKPREQEPEYHGAFGFEQRILNGGVIGGTLAMVGAAVWFILGWQAGFIYFYPPVLFVVGLVSFFKGLTGQSD